MELVEAVSASLCTTSTCKHICIYLYVACTAQRVVVYDYGYYWLEGKCKSTRET